jgi:translin
LKQQKATQNLDNIAERAHALFTAKDAAREEALRLCREIIRHSALCIRSIHRRDDHSAQKNLVAARSLLDELEHKISKHDDLAQAGFVHDAQKEFAEATLTLSIIKQQALPEPEELKISYPAYLNGLGEAVGELRRYLLDRLRQNDFSRCEELLEAMEDIYDCLMAMDFSDAITWGLRRVTDNVRGILEKTRGDLTLALRQKELVNKLENLQHNL